MNADLEQLKLIVAGPEYDTESRDYIKNLEEKFAQAVLDAKLLTIPAVTDYITYLESEIDMCKAFLSEKTLELDDAKRLQLHERKEACRDFLRYFKPVDSVGVTIKQTLHALQGKKDLE